MGFQRPFRTSNWLLVTTNDVHMASQYRKVWKFISLQSCVMGRGVEEIVEYEPDLM